MNYGSVLDTNYSQFSDDEKLNYGLKIALSRLQTELKRAWYQEPKDFAPKGPETIYKNKLPSYSDIAGYYLIDPFCKVNNVDNTSVITNVKVGDILNNSTNASGWGFGDVDGTKDFYNLSGVQNVRDNATNITNTAVAQTGLSKRMFTKYRYWENGLTGKNSSVDGSAGSAGNGTHTNKIEPENAILSYVGGSLGLSRIWNAYDDNLGNNNSEDQFFKKLTSFSSPIKIIDPSNVNTSDYTDITKAHPFLEIYVQVPTISTSSGNSNGTDNIGFFNPVLKQSLGDVEGFNYVIRGWSGNTAKWADLTIETGAVNNTNILYFLNNPGFILCYGVKDIVNGLNLSYSYPPVISFLKYTGETFEDGIISQGLTLPDKAVSNDKDLFIKTDDNTIHRFDGSYNSVDDKKWVQLGGSSSSSSATSAISTNTLNISTNTYKLTGITYGGATTAGTYDITGGNFGGVSRVYSNGNVQLIGGYDGVNSSGDVVVKQDNIERMRFTSSNIYIRTSDDNKLIIDDNETKDVVSMTFESQGFVLFKGVAGGVQPTKYDMILDRGDNFWSAFTNSRDWDCYKDADKYNRNAKCATMFLQYYSQGDINMCNTGGNVTIGAGGTTAGYLCIGGSSPVYPIDIRFLGPNGNWSGTYATFKYNDTALQSSVSASEVGLKALSAIWADGVGFIASSDRRIKENIRDVPDDLSLKMLRALPVSYYDYKDKLINGVRSTIGFIAQEVKEIMPMAVSLQKNIIPNEMRNLDNFSWETITDEKGNETFKLIVNDLEDVSGNTKYRFYCSNQDLKEVVHDVLNLENEPKSFIFEKKWENVFLYGKEVNDFHTIDKNKIFAVAFSATQQIDRIQQQHKIQIKNLEAENTTLKARLDAIEAKLISAGI
jgi:hypothetical protein